MRLLTAAQILDPETESHYASIRSIQVITDPHYHDFYEFFLVRQGEIYHIVNGHRELLGPGSLMLMRPHDRHHYEQNGSTAYELMNLAFSPATLDALLGYLGQTALAAGLAAAPVPALHLLTPPELEEVARRMQELTTGHKGEQKGRVRALLADLFVRYVVAQPPQPQTPVPDWLTGLMRSMRRQEHFTAGLPRLYELSPVSPEHLARSMQKHLGKTPTDWLNDLKLHYAADLLAHTAEPILAVALQSGFPNLSHFYHLFKERFGVPPARYRKAQRPSPILVSPCGPSTRKA